MLGNIAKARISITGTRPLLWHAFTPSSIPLERQEKSGVAGNDPEEWKKTVLYDTQSRQLYIPATYVFACIRDGSKYTKKGRASYQTMVTATLTVQEEQIFIDHCTLPDIPSVDVNLPVYLDIRGVRNPATRGVNVRYRIACRPGWSCSFHLIWDKSIVPVKVMESILHDAGLLVGIGNGRNIGMGRFEVSQFEASETSEE